MSSVSAGFVSPIKSIQTVSINLGGATSATATITAVVVANTVVMLNGNHNNAVTSDNPATYFNDVVLTNTTTITATSQNTSPSTMVVKATVVEYKA